jgi:hypothetical protein
LDGRRRRLSATGVSEHERARQHLSPDVSERLQRIFATLDVLAEVLIEREAETSRGFS